MTAMNKNIYLYVWLIFLLYLINICIKTKLLTVRHNIYNDVCGGISAEQYDHPFVR